MARSMIEARFKGRLGKFDLDIGFCVPATGVTAIFGESGCGKTTLLRCIAGLRHLPGYLKVKDQVWQDDSRRHFLKPHRRTVGYVFQEASLFPHLSVRGNLFYGARRAAGRSGLADHPAKSPDADEVIHLLGLAPLLERTPHALSGGERQRVAMGRALLSGPHLLLMDEPLAGLDRATREDILPYLEVLHRRLAIPILYVSHDIAEVSGLADRVVVLSAGRKVAEGKTSDVLERLELDSMAGEFEAGVSVTARVLAHDDGFCLTHLKLCDQDIAIPKIDVAVNDDIRLRIRARDVSLAITRPENITIRNVLSGMVEQVSEEKTSAFAETLIDIGGTRLRARITREAVAQLGLRPGMKVFALVKSMAFDRHDHRRIGH